MGSGIVQVAAQNGHQVVLVDLNEHILMKSKTKLEKIMNRLVEKEKITSDEAAAIQGTRTGRNIPMLNKSIADFSANLRYQDLLNTQGNIKSLYGTGINTLEGVRNAEMGMGAMQMNAGMGMNAMGMGMGMNPMNTGMGGMGMGGMGMGPFM